MNRSRDCATQAPPLWLWPIAVALVAGVFVATLDDYLDDTVTRREADDHAQLERIAEFARRRAADPDALHVIALGDSSLRNATFFDEDMDRYSREKGGPEIQFLRITRAGARLHDYLSLLGAVFEAEPDVLILQTWLLPDRTSRKQRGHYRVYQTGGVPSYSVSRARHRERLLRGTESLQHQTWIVDRVLASFASTARFETGLADRFMERQREIVCNPAFRERLLERRTRRYRDDREYAVDPTAASTVDLLIDQAAAAGTRLVFADVPIASPIAGLPGVRRKVALQRSFLALHVGDPAFDHWRFDERIPDTSYCDWVHLSSAGRGVYMDWFVERLREFAAERDSR